MKKPLLLVTLGYPGSGKTYFSERLAKEYHLFHLNGDRIRLAMFENPSYSREEHDMVYAFADYLAETFLKHGVSVIYDANFNFRKSRAKARRIAQKTRAAYRLIWVKTSESKAIERFNKRARLKTLRKKEIYRPIDLNNFKELRDEIQPPGKREPYIEINGHQVFKQQILSFHRQLQTR